MTYEGKQSIAGGVVKHTQRDESVEQMKFRYVTGKSDNSGERRGGINENVLAGTASGMTITGAAAPVNALS